MSLTRVSVLVAAALLGGCSLFARWTGGEDNAEPPAELTAIASPQEVTKIWSERVGKGAGKLYLKLAPGVSDDRLYAVDHRGLIVALDAETGKTLWETPSKAPISSPVEANDGLLLVGTSEATVLAFHLEDGSPAWQAPVSSEVLAAPRIAEGIVVVHTVDGRVFGLNAADGKRLWVYDRSVPVLTLRGTGALQPVPGAVVVGFDSGKLAALSMRDGRPLWETSIAIPSGRSELERMVDIDSAPKIEGSTVYVVTYQGRVAAVELFSGRIQWVRDMSSYAGLDADGRRLYVTDDAGQVWGLDENSGGALWKQDQLHGRALTGPVVFGPYVVVGDYQGYLHWLSRDDGQIVARSRADDSPMLATPVVHGDTLYAVTRDGTLAAFRTGS